LKKIILILIVVAVGWYGNYRYYRHQPQAETFSAADHSESQPAQSNAGSFKCDGRTHCSHMTSCAEATFFIKNCPGTKMDGNNDGVPCESQWCR